MSKSDIESRQEESIRQTAKVSAGARIDAAHEIVNEEEAATGTACDAATLEPPEGEAVAQQLRAQASQLALHLRAREKELDHREAEVNARFAQFERDARAARLWLREREAELNRRDEELGKQEREVEKCLTRLAIAEAAHGNRPDPDDPRAAKPEEHAAAAGPELLAREEVLRRTAETLEARRRLLDQAEARLADAQAEMQELHGQLRETRRQAEEEDRLQRERFAAEQRRALAELEKRRQAVRRRSEHADRCRAALEQVRAELGRMHRETLEIRLGTEELWAQLSGAAPPAALTRCLGRIRTKLADHHRLANAELHKQKEELEGIRGQLAEQFEKLVKQKHEFEQWAARRQEETEQHATRLITREEQLHQKEAELQDQVHRWQAERLEYQHEIRRLRAQLREPEEAAIPA